MKTRNKVLAALLSAAMAVSLAACGSSSSSTSTTLAADDATEATTGVSASEATTSDETTSSGDVTEIEWWTPNWDQEISETFKSEFEAENPDIKVKLVITDWDTYKSKITTAISADGAPQVISILLTDVKPFAKKGLLDPLNDTGAAAGIDFDDFIDAALDITSLDGQAYGLPFRYDGSGVYYNKDLLAEYGYDEFPTTWDDMIAMCDKMLENGQTGFAMPLGNQTNAVTRLVQQIYTYGGQVLNDDETEAQLNTDAVKKAFTNIVSSIKNGEASASSLEYDNNTTREAFGSGETAFNITGPFDSSTLDEEYPDLNYATAVLPGDGGMGVTTANGWCLAIPTNCDEDTKDAAIKFAAYVEEPENQARITATFPASKTSIQDEKFSTDILKPFAEQLENSKPEPAYERWAEIEPIIYQYIESAVSGNMTVDEACEGMNNDVNALLNS